MIGVTMAQYLTDMRQTALRGLVAISSAPNANTGRQRVCGEQEIYSVKTAGAMEPSAVLNAMSGLTVSIQMTGYSS